VGGPGRPVGVGAERPLVIRDIGDLADGSELRAEVGVVGAGFAGIDLARYLGRHGVRVVLLESGRADFDPATQELARVRSVGKPLRTPDPDGGFTPYLAAVFRGESRIRQLGGTSTIWTGKWRMPDPVNFEERPWVPHSGWPVGLDELRPFYAEIAAEYGLGDVEGHAHRAGSARLRQTWSAAGLTSSFLFWEQTPLRLADRFGAELRASQDVDVVLGANATEILLDDALGHVRAVRFASLDGRRLTLRADRFVLAAGGLEVPRLLLASNRQLPAGVGNAHDLVGRFFADHPKHKRGTLLPGPGMKAIASDVATDPRPRFHLTFSLDAATQRQRSLVHHAISVSPVYRYMVDFPSATAVAVKDALRDRDARRLARSALALLASPRALAKVGQKLVYREHRGPVSHYRTTMYVEQVPNPESRVLLGPRLDALGMPELVVDWRFVEKDHEAFQGLLKALPAAFADAGLGHLDFGPEPLSLDDDTVDAAHHIGATRMARIPQEGVVDPDCAVFGVDNLFVASSSVFPTGDSATPTFTILALARRLGVHLLRQRVAA
jgi:choline dehydrogenase-like flavoprotein